MVVGCRGDVGTLVTGCAPAGHLRGCFCPQLWARGEVPGCGQSCSATLRPVPRSTSFVPAVVAGPASASSPHGGNWELESSRTPRARSAVFLGLALPVGG